MKTNQKNTPDCLKDKILSLVKEYYKSSSSKDKFVPGKSYIHYGGRYYDEKEMGELGGFIFGLLAYARTLDSEV
jgi:hypothetical protein